MTIDHETGKQVTYRLREDSGAETVIEAADLREARQRAREWVREGDYPDMEHTISVDCQILDSATGERVESVSVTIDPPEPPCPADDGRVGSRPGHDWQSPHSIVGGIKENPGVWGHGGGVRITEVCMRCGCGRHTDTGANDHCGRRITSVRYERHEYVAALAALREDI